MAFTFFLRFSFFLCPMYHWCIIASNSLSLFVYIWRNSHLLMRVYRLLYNIFIQSQYTCVYNYMNLKYFYYETIFIKLYNFAINWLNDVIYLNKYKHQFLLYWWYYLVEYWWNMISPNICIANKRRQIIFTVL